MTTYFWDTSALIKRYITEKGSGWVRNTIQPSLGNTIIIVNITSVELASAIARRISDNSVSQRTGQAVQLWINRHVRREYIVIALTSTILGEAVAVTYRQTIRAYDAVQLATAIEANRRIVAEGLPPLIFLSADKRLLVAASNEGLLTDNPESYP